MENLGNIITNHSEKSPDKWAIKYAETQYSFFEFNVIKQGQSQRYENVRPHTNIYSQC